MCVCEVTDCWSSSNLSLLLPCGRFLFSFGQPRCLLVVLSGHLFADGHCRPLLGTFHFAQPRPTFLLSSSSSFRLLTFCSLRVNVTIKVSCAQWLHMLPCPLVLLSLLVVQVVSRQKYSGQLTNLLQLFAFWGNIHTYNWSHHLSLHRLADHRLSLTFDLLSIFIFIGDNNFLHTWQIFKIVSFTSHT